MHSTLAAASSESAGGLRRSKQPPDKAAQKSCVPHAHKPHTMTRMTMTMTLGKLCHLFPVSQLNSYVFCALPNITTTTEDSHWLPWIALHSPLLRPFTTVTLANNPKSRSASSLSPHPIHPPPHSPLSTRPAWLTQCQARGVA